MMEDDQHHSQRGPYFDPYDHYDEPKVVETPPLTAEFAHDDDTSRTESLSCNFDANERRRRVLRCPLMSTSHFTRVLMHRYNSDLHSLLSIT